MDCLFLTASVATQQTGSHNDLEFFQLKVTEVGCGLLRRPGEVIRISAGGVEYFRKSCRYIDWVSPFSVSVLNSLALLSLDCESRSTWFIKLEL